MAGAALAAILPLGSFLMAAAAIYLAGLVHPVLAFLLETLWCWQALAVKGLYTESMRVKKKLEEQDLPGARSAVCLLYTSSAMTAGAITYCLQEQSFGSMLTAFGAVGFFISDNILIWRLLSGYESRLQGAVLLLLSLIHICCRRFEICKKMRLQERNRNYGLTVYNSCSLWKY